MEDLHDRIRLAEEDVEEADKHGATLEGMQEVIRLDYELEKVCLRC